jgi:2-C-methyl-D-erythritol 2,4-cyclodiphosphate synthase
MASCGDEYISVEHLFMGITHRADTMASLLLEKRGGVRARLREEVKKLIAERISRGFHNGVPQGGGGAAASALPRHEDKDESRGERELIRVLVQRITLLEEKVAALSAVNTVLHAPLVGMGFDSHRLKEGRELVVGGIKIPFRAGLDGHSDADVLLHAVIDALLGALGRGDIGTHFPDSDERYRGISSVRLLERCAALVDESSMKVASLDSIIIAQEPRLAPHIGGMKSTIAAVLSLPAGRVSIKAKTAEGMGYVGEGQGIAAYALAVLVR